jgi:glycosyltransferase involved in cell wall biosynthesis
MIYLDVTSAAASPVNMGVQRMVRGIYALWRDRPDVVPLRWDFSRQRYATLSPREALHVRQPFANYTGATATPGRWSASHLWAAWRDRATRGSRGLEHGALLAHENILLVPDLCWDKRIHAWSRFKNLPGRKVAVFHDAMPLRLPGQADSDDALFAEYVRALAQLDLVICISREVEHDLHGFWDKFGLAPAPTRVLPWPVPFEGPRPTSPPNQAAARVIYVARLKLRKNHLVLLEACENLWRDGLRFELDLIGIEDAFKDTRIILRRVRALAAQGRPVAWRKHISDDELTAAYRDCSFTAFPSRLEGFGLPIIESLWHRRPVICGRNGAIGEVAEGGGCYQVDQDNPAELAGAIRFLLEDSAVYVRLYTEAGARAFRSWDDYRRDLEAILLPSTAHAS